MPPESLQVVESIDVVESVPVESLEQFEIISSQCDKKAIHRYKKKLPKMCFFFLVPEGIYRLDMTKKKSNHSKKCQNALKMSPKWPRKLIFDLNSLEIPPKIP